MASHMAQKVRVLLVDDLDAASVAAETVRFGLDGVEYEIDLSRAHADRLRDGLESFVAAARRTDGRILRGGNRATASGNRDQNQAIRQWAARNGYVLAERGRIPAYVIGEFEAARAQGQA